MVPYRWFSIPLLAIVYVALMLLLTPLARLMPEYVLPIQPAAGLAVSVLLLVGLRCWPGVFLGAYIASLGPDFTSWYHHQAIFTALIATLQAVLGALLTRRFFRTSVPLVSERSVLGFLLLAGPVACLVSVAANFAFMLPLNFLSFWPGVTAPQSGEGWIMAWASNSLGVLIFAPLMLILWPGARGFRRDWGGRVALPLLVTALLVLVGHVAVDRYEHRVAQQADVRVIEDVLDRGFVHLDRAIESLHSVEYFFHASDEVTRQEFAVFTSMVLRWPGLHDIEWVPQVSAAQRVAFELGELQSDPENADVRPVTIREEGSDGRQVRAARRSQYYPSLFVEPSTVGEEIIGFDYGSSPSRRAALERARDNATAVASEPVTLLKSGERGISVFIPLYNKNFDPQTAAVPQRREALRGFIKGNFEVQNLFEILVTGAQAANVQVRLSDLTGGYMPQLLINTLEDGTVPSLHRDIPFAGRLLQVETWLPPSWQSGVSPVARLYQGFSVLAAFLVGLAVLTAAGRNTAAETRVRERTNALRASEQNLEVTLRSIGDGVVVTDTRGCVTRLNPVAEHLLGLLQENAVGRPVEEVFTIIDEHSRKPVPVPVDEVLHTGLIRGLANHTVLVARDGQERAIAESAAPINGPDDSVQGMVLVFRDVGEERDVKRALESSEKRYRQLIEQAPYGIFIQTDGRFAYLNPKAVALLGGTDERQLVGLPVLDFLHPDIRPAVALRIEQLNQLGVPAAALEERWLRLDGTILQAEVTAVPHLYEGTRGALVMLQDISDRKAAESQRDRFFDLSLDPQCIIGSRGFFVRVNFAFSEVLGWQRQEFFATRYLDLVHPDDLDMALEEEQKIRAGGVIQQVELRFLCKDGGWRWLSWSAVSAEDNGLLYAVARDVTANHEIIEALTVSRREAESANRAKSAFLATMSHEIRTPMNGVIGLVDVLAHSSLNEHQADLVHSVRISAQSLLRQIDDILDFSKIEAGRLELENATVSIESVIEELCNSLLPVATGKGVELRVFVAPDIPDPIVADETRLRQVFYNLVGNAIKFSGGRAERPGLVDVRAELASRDPLQLKFTVIDNGIGMSMESLNNVFEPFAQGEVSTTRRFGGTGLGLAICKRLMDLMGGGIHIESHEGSGSTVTVSLPVAESSDQPATAPFDLDGIHCILVDSPAVNTDDLGVYLGSAGASVEKIADLSGVSGAVAGHTGVTVVILDKRAPAHASLPIAGLFTAVDNVSYVLITHARRHRSRPQVANVVTLDGEILRRKDLLRTVAVAAGRVSPQVRQNPAERPPAQPIPMSVDEASACGRLILVAEDDEINRKVISQQLSLLGYAAEIVNDGMEALNLWRRGHFALLLTDLHMPGMDGYSLAHAIRSEEVGETRIPIVALTANALAGEASRAYEAGINDYLTKPVSLELLAAVIERSLGRPADTQGGKSEGSAEVGDPLIDVVVLGDFIGSEPAKLREFLQQYRIAAEGLQREIHQAAQRGDLQQVANFSHRLKSSSRWVGATALGDLCAELERLSSAGNKTAVSQCLLRFDVNHAAVMSAIEIILAESE